MDRKRAFCHGSAASIIRFAYANNVQTRGVESSKLLKKVSSERKSAGLTTASTDWSTPSKMAPDCLVPHVARAPLPAASRLLGTPGFSSSAVRLRRMIAYLG